MSRVTSISLIKRVIKRLFCSWHTEHLHKIRQKQAEPGWIFNLKNKLFHAFHENLRFVIKYEVEVYPLLAHDVKGLKVQFAKIKSQGQE
jgi:hypothetical protein